MLHIQSSVYAKPAVKPAKGFNLSGMSNLPQTRIAGKALFGTGYEQVQPSSATEDFWRSPDSERESRWHNLQRVLRHAENAVRLVPNYSGRRYGALVQLEDGTEGLSANVEASRQVTLCDLRLALSAAQNRWIEKQGDNPFGLAGNTRLPSVKTIYLVNGDADGKEPPIPCSDCQEWLASPLCPPDAEVISLEKDSAKAGQPVMRQRTVRDMLPLYKSRASSSFTSQEPIDTLPVVFSERANQVANKLPDAKVKALLEEAKQAYLQGQGLARESRLETGAAVLFAPSGHIATGNRVDWSSRLHEPAELNGAAQGLASLNRLRQWLNQCLSGMIAPLQYQAPQSIQAIAYYGDDPNLPPIASLGRIARKKGSAQTLVLSVESEQIQVRTIRDFLPELYRAN